LCANQGLGDTAIGTVVANTPVTTPIDTFDLSGNKLTIVPKDLTQYAQLTRVTLANNSITSVGSTDLSLTGNVVLIDLSNNQISSIAAGSLPGMWPKKFYLLKLFN
jgi:Leucine-rich repeat (LRR) protein